MKYNKMPIGYGIIQTKVMMDPSISAKAKLVYCLLCSMTGSKQYCFPSIKTMMESFNVSDEYIYSALKELKDRNLVLVSKLYKDARNNHKYEVLFYEDEQEVIDVQHPEKQDVYDVIKQDLINNNSINKESSLDSVSSSDTLSTLDSDSLRLKDNKNYLLNARAEEKLTKKTKKEKPATEAEKELYRHIWDTLIKRNDEVFTDYGKEGKATHGLVKKIMDRCKKEPSSSLAFFDSLVSMFEIVKAKHDKDDFYKDLPFTPSTLNSSGIFDRILTIGKNLQEQEAINKAKDERYQQRLKKRHNR